MNSSCSFSATASSHRVCSAAAVKSGLVKQPGRPALRATSSARSPPGSPSFLCAVDRSEHQAPIAPRSSEPVGGVGGVEGTGGADVGVHRGARAPATVALHVTFRDASGDGLGGEPSAQAVPTPPFRGLEVRRGSAALDDLGDRVAVQPTCTGPAAIAVDPAPRGALEDAVGAEQVPPPDPGGTGVDRPGWPGASAGRGPPGTAPPSAAPPAAPAPHPVAPGLEPGPLPLVGRPGPLRPRPAGERLGPRGQLIAILKDRCQFLKSAARIPEVGCPVWSWVPIARGRPRGRSRGFLASFIHATTGVEDRHYTRGHHHLRGTLSTPSSL